jgi:hypothetical protein
MISYDEINVLADEVHHTFYYGRFKIEFNKKIVMLHDGKNDGFYFEFFNDKINWEQFPKNSKLISKKVKDFADIKYKQFIKLSAFL